jgi:membrane fusion protein
VSDSLFRTEVIKNQGERLLGEVILSQPISYYIFSGFFISTTLIGLLFLLVNDYSRKQSVIGFLVPDNGIVSVYPSQISILNQLMVNEDDYVHINSALFKLQIEQGTNETAFTSDQILETLNAQESVLNETKVQEELFIKNIMAS